MADDLPLVAVSSRPQAEIIDGEIVVNRVGNFSKVLDCLRSVGLAPMIATSETDLSRVSAVVIPGGGDISPARYGGTVSEVLYGVDDEQDETDLALVAHATAHNLPLLGICRGAQVINIARGGTLYEDLPAGSDEHHNSIATSNYENVFVSHEVRIEPGSRTAAALRSNPGQPAEPLIVPVRSAHHQSVRELGKDLSIVAESSDGIVEAFEANTGWTVAVQWHPEAELAEGRLKRGLFAALADEVLRRDVQVHMRQLSSDPGIRPAIPDLV